MDVGIHKRILNRATFGPTAQDLIEIGTKGYVPWLNQPLDWRGIDDSALETALAAAPGAGYVEADVAEVARVLTGRTYRFIHLPTGVYKVVFGFRAAHHDPGPKTVMGWSTLGFSGRRGVMEGEDLLRYLARHTSTANRIATKLCNYFVHDSPPATLVQKTARIIQNGEPIANAMHGIFNYLVGHTRTPLGIM